MKRFNEWQNYVLFTSILSVFLIIAGCGQWNAPATLNAAAATVTIPTVSSVAPVDAAISAPVNTKVTAIFSEQMDPSTVTTTTFTLDQGLIPIPGTVSYTGVTAVFTPTTDFTAYTTYTARITTGTKSLLGKALESTYVWNFTTGATPDTTPPTVIGVIPFNTSTGVAFNTALTATFSEAMDPLTITTTTFTLKHGTTPVLGIVTQYGATAAFIPVGNLTASTTYTATITTGTTDLAGNALVSDYVWNFTTSATPDTTKPTVTFVNPADTAIGVCINKTISTPFSEAMNPSTINTANYRVLGVAGTVSYDTIKRIATFNPITSFADNTPYTLMITTGVKDLAGNTLASDYISDFTTWTNTCATSVVLGAAAPIGGLGGAAGITNQGLFTRINGNMATTAASTLVTGFQDSVGDIYTITPLNDGIVNGRIYTDAPTPGGVGVGGNAVTFAIATQALSDAQTAFNNMSPGLLPGGIDPGAGQLGGLALPPGIYKAAGGSFLVTGSDLTLDAGGDLNAVFVFQMASTLTVGVPGAPRNIILINGAQAKNIFWQVGSSATINEAGGGTMVGTIISSAGTAFSTPGNATIVILDGRALCLNASLTMVNTVINVPAL